MDETDQAGWVKLHRRLQASRVWRKGSNACRLLFVWLLMAARREPATVVWRGSEYHLRRGELVASLAETAAWARISVKEARCGYAWLEAEGMIARDGGVVRIVNYPIYQGGESDCEPGHDKGHEIGHDISGRKGTKLTWGNVLKSKGKRGSRRSAGARSSVCKGHDMGHETGHEVEEKTARALSSPSTRAGAGANVVGEVKEINPPTPFCKKGVRVSSDPSALSGADRDRYEQVLAMWREEREKAGLCFQKDAGTIGGAVVLARDWLGQARLTMRSLRAGMQKLIRRILNDAKCSGYTLRALARNVSTYCPDSIEKRERTKVRWQMVCDVCGHSQVTRFFPEGTPAPAPQGCVRMTRRDGFRIQTCQGTMHAEEMP